MTLSTPQPCGAIRVVRWFEGMAQVEAWCSRTQGPCPYPGAGLTLQRNGRLCIVDFARLNRAQCSDGYHDRGHGGMFPETCSRCEEECRARLFLPSDYDPALLAEEVVQ